MSLKCSIQKTTQKQTKKKQTNKQTKQLPKEEAATQQHSPPGVTVPTPPTSNKMIQHQSTSRFQMSTTIYKEAYHIQGVYEYYHIKGAYKQVGSQLFTQA